MERHFSNELKELKAQILEMAGHVEKGIDRAVQALAERSQVRLAEIKPLEAKINQAHIDIDNVCLGILARQAPVAADLRLILAVTKINTDLERMGDQAVNLSHNIEHYLEHESLDLAKEIPQMAKLVRTMVRESLDAFVSSDSELARSVLLSDDAVDQFKNRLLEQLKTVMKTDSNSIEAAIGLILMARNLERIADHATNIGEDVIFVSTGQDVRHGIGRAAENRPSSEKHEE